MEHPFDSVPLIWLIQEDILGSRLPTYEAKGWGNLVTIWKTALSRADVIVFPDFSLPMMYSLVDTGNFYVIPGSPVNVLETESFTRSHSRDQARKDNGFSDADLIVLIMGNSFLFEELPWEYASIMSSLVPEIKRITGTLGMKRFTSKQDIGGPFKFIFLFGNSSFSHGSALQGLASRLGFPADSIKHYGVDSEVNNVLLMADLVIYGSLLEEPTFPPLLVRAMSFRIPVIVPKLQNIEKYVVDQVNGLIFDPHDLDTLVRAFSLVIEDKKLSRLAYSLASSGKWLSKNILASECIADYARLLENVIQFPSDAILPLPVSHIRQTTWAWDLIEKDNKQTYSAKDKNVQINHKTQRHNIVDVLEELVTAKSVQNASEISIESLIKDLPTQLDWDTLHDMEILEESDRLEREEIAERTERNLGEWNIVYNDAKKADRNTNFEKNERDEAQLERVGLHLCIYEIYSGKGAWPLLQNSPLYRGISLSKRSQRPRSDDVDAVAQLPVLNDAFYRDLLCEFGAMFSIANKVDNIHNMPWIGFQPWHAAAKKLSLSNKSKNVLEQAAKGHTMGDVVYYWAVMNIDQKDKVENGRVDFWSMCDIFNAGHCRTVFEDAFRLMYGLPEGMTALPPMPDDGDQWSSLHSWMMPTPSFLQFIMFSRMFVDSLNSLIQRYSSNASCVLAFSELERRHCYCRVLEVLVNVWAYHSARRMVYLDPSTGQMTEQHPLEQRTGQMWVKYFEFTLLKSMDEDLAEEADDGMNREEKWLWPLTGEVHWSGVFDKEREDRYRRKRNKKRNEKDKTLDRQTNGYRQKPLGRHG